MLSTVNLDFLAFHNYYDRVVDVHNSRASYSTYKLITKENIDFNPNDGISTEVILEDFSNVLTTEPDYMLVWYTAGTDPTAIIHSRWYIMESKRLRGGQWKLTLRRDVIADYNTQILNAPCFVEKGMLNYDDPFIFNDEGITFNQIKQAEYLLKDNSCCPWLLAYVAKKNSESDSLQSLGGGTFAPGDTINLNGTFTYVGAPDYTTSNINLWAQSYNLTVGSLKSSFTYNLVHGLKGACCIKRTYDGYESIWQDWFLLDNKTAVSSNETINTYYKNSTSAEESSDYLARVFRDYLGTPITNVEKEASFTSRSNTQLISTEALSIYQLKQNKVVYDSTTHKYWQIIVEPNQITNGISLLGAGKIRVLEALANWYTNPPGVGGPFISINEDGDIDKTAYLCGNLTEYKIGLIDCTGSFLNGTTTYKYNNTGHINTNAAYNIVALPYADGHFKYNGQVVGYSQKNAALAFINALSEEPEALIYDLLLVPYSPIPQIEGDDTDPDDIEFTISSVLGPFTPGSADNIYYSPVYQDVVTPTANDVKSIMFNVIEPSFRTIIDAPNEIASMVIENPVERKVEILTKFTRLCSPNYNGIFDFNIQKNGGLNYFEVNVTYRAYQPYIHVNPHFAGLYGKDYDDARGMICGGSFSLARTKSAWREYELQNKNYQQIFDRQIQNLETQYDIQNKLKGWEIAAGSLQGGGTGAAAGAMVGGPWGAAIGGAIGGLASLGGGIIDYNYQKDLQAETLDYTKDIFAMNLDNIKAIPNSLTKISSFDVDNKIFPFIEVYGCTPYEESALRNKLKYSGMTVGRIDTLSSFKKTGVHQFVQGKIIYVQEGTQAGETQHMDAHLATEIYNEVMKGLRI